MIQAEINARTALDTLVRLIRMAGNDPSDLGFQAIDPDPDGNTQWDSIRIRSDWNPPDGVLNGSYEDVIFTVSNGTLMIQDPGTAPPAEFVEDIDLVSFSYFDSTGSGISDPVAQSGSIVRVDILVQAQPQNLPNLQLSSASTIRRRDS